MADAANIDPIPPVQAAEVVAWDVEADVVVVGGGIAGVCAAIAAAESGGEVVLVERASQLGGTSAMSSGLVYLGGGTATQRACGVEDSTQAMYDFLMLACGPGVDAAKTKRYCEGSLEHHDWLVAHGVEFKPELYPEGDVQPPTDAGLVYTGGEDTWPFAPFAAPAQRGHHARFPNESGGYLMERLGEALAATDASVEVDTRMDRLVVDDGRVVGISAVREGVTRFVRARGGVVLAAGGFLFNPDMIERFVPEAARCNYPLGTDGDDGRGIRVAQGVGAQVANMDALECHLPLHPPRRLGRGIIVDGGGRRFVNEDAYNGRIGQKALLEHDGVAFLIVDESIDEPNWIGLRVGWAAETAEELAAEIGVPPVALAATIDRYNVDAANGCDTDFHKREEFLQPLVPPFGAVDLRVTSTFYATFTLGGVTTDVDARALEADGAPIPGLFVVGRTAAGIPAHGYVSGISLGDGSFFGRVAGAAAAADAAPA